MIRSRAWLGVATILFALGFNVPYALLAARFDYPDILRRPPGEVLARFAEGGAALVLTWEAFLLFALLLVLLSVALAVTPARMERAPALAIGVAVAGALAGVAQAIGLSRWVFVVPELARLHGAAGSTREVHEATEHAFQLLNLFGGVAIGEHIGQLLTALFAGLLGTLQWKEGARRTALLGHAAATMIAFGTGEGLAIAMGADGSAFAAGTVLGFLTLTLWLIATGICLIGWRRPAAVAAAA